MPHLSNLKAMVIIYFLCPNHGFKEFIFFSENNKLTEDLKAAQDALEAQKNECKEEKSALQASINEKEKQVEEEQTKNAELATKVTTLEGKLI